MANKADHGHTRSISEDEDLAEWDGDIWGKGALEEYVKNKPGRCLVLIRGFVVDATNYLSEHVSTQVLGTKLHPKNFALQPGGVATVRRYSLRTGNMNERSARDATWAFNGGLNNHSRAATRRMRELRIAKYIVQHT